MTKTIKVISMGTLVLLLAACTSSAPTLPDSPSFKQGNKDGCATATGEYTKSSEMFRGNADYQDGWYYGRKHCNPGRA
jgi:hypothetical protein